MTDEEFKAFKSAWENYPSQDNEGFVPDRGGFKCGWFAALQWVKEKQKACDLCGIQEGEPTEMEIALVEVMHKRSVFCTVPIHGDQIRKKVLELRVEKYLDNLEKTKEQAE